MKKPLYLRPYILFIAAVLLALGFYCLFFTTDIYLPRDVTVLNSGWRLISSSGTYNNVSIGEKVEGADLGEAYSIEHRLPLGSAYSTPSILFQSDHQSVTIYVDDVKIYTSSRTTASYTMVRNNYVYMPSDYYGKMLKIVIRSDSARYYDTIQNVYFGNFNQLHEISVNNSVFRYFVLCIFFTASCFLMAYGVNTLKKFREYSRFLPICLFFVFSVAITAVHAPTIPEIVSAENVSFLQHITLYLTPLALLVYLYISAEPRRRKWLLPPLALQILFLLFSCLLHVLSVLPLSKSVDYFIVVTLINFIFLLLYLFSAKTKQPSFIALAALITLLLLFLADVYCYKIIKPVEDFRLIKSALPVLCIYAMLRLTGDISDIKYKNLFKKEIHEYVSDTVLSNYEMLEKSIREMHKTSHDLKNHYTILFHLYESGKHEEALSYLQNLCSDYANTLPYCNTGNVVVDSIINDKLSRAQELHARITRLISLPPSLPFADRDLCSILVNVLDNALDALARVQDGFLEFSLFHENQMLFIMCKNSKSGATLEADGKFITTKSSKLTHGYGLSIITSIVEKYEGSVHTEYDDQTFAIYISLPLGAEQGL